MSTFNILLATATLDDPSHRVVSVPDDHSAVAFIKSCVDANDYACIDMGDDDDCLLDMWAELNKLPDVRLPVCIHGVIHVIAY